MQLASYHVNKLLRSNLIALKDDVTVSSKNGRQVTHYIPARSAVLITPSLEILKKEGEEEVGTALGTIMKRVFGAVFIGLASFLAFNKLSVAIYSALTRIAPPTPISNPTANQGTGWLSVSGSGFPISTSVSQAFHPLVLLITVTGPMTIGVIAAYLSFRRFSRRPERKDG